jgi:hypothetical protein
LPLSSLPEVTLATRADRIGTISFGPTVDPLLALLSRSPWSLGKPAAPPAFRLIEDARTVYDLILITQAERQSPRGADGFGWSSPRHPRDPALVRRCHIGCLPRRRPVRCFAAGCRSIRHHATGGVALQ